VPAAERVTLQLYVMSKCPFATQVQQVAARLVSELGSALELKQDYIVSEGQGGQLQALHGEAEVRGNILQLCAMEHHDQGMAMQFISCLALNFRKIPDNWEGCAASAGINASTLMGCYTSPAGEQLLRASMQRSQAAGAQGSPTIVIAAQKYEGSRDRTALLRAICPSYTKEPTPEACTRLPPELPVKLLVLTDLRCAACATAALEHNLKQRFFPALQVRTVDYSTDDGRRLYRELGLKGLPALLFDESIEQHERYARIRSWVQRRGRYRLLRAPTHFDPTAEICDNNRDDTGNGRVDCADSTCRAKLICRPERPRRLEVFVMSQCPFAARGLLAMREVLKNFGGRLAFDMHYIAEESGGGFSSLHGQSEVEENLRQLCARKYYGRRNRHLDYIWCRMADFRSNDWRTCVKAGMSADRIERCASGREGRQLLARDLKQAKALGISGSPTWLANNRHKFNGITAEAIKEQVCKHNPGLRGCANKLSDGTDGASGSCDQ